MLFYVSLKYNSILSIFSLYSSFFPQTTYPHLMADYKFIVSSKAKLKYFLVRDRNQPSGATGVGFLSL